MNHFFLENEWTSTREERKQTENEGENRKQVLRNNNIYSKLKVCNYCGEKLKQRPRDDKSTALLRTQKFQRFKKPFIESLRKSYSPKEECLEIVSPRKMRKIKFSTINADQKIEDVTRDMFSALQESFEEKSLDKDLLMTYAPKQESLETDGVIDNQHQNIED
eukprot:Awhi_evm1s9744